MTSSCAAVSQMARKRDGVTLQPFDTAKLRNAVSKAWKESVGTVDEKALNKVIKTSLEALTDETVDVETVQDAVETALMKHGAFAVAKSYIVYRHQRAEARLARVEVEPDPMAIANYIHPAKYGRHIPELRRREVHAESVARVEAMHISQHPSMADEIRWAFDFVREKKVLASMRSLQFGGDAILQNNCRIFNCSFEHVDRLEAFSQALYLLLCGCGVGYSVQLDHVDKLPAIGYVDAANIRHHVVEDTIEGWANGLKALLSSFVDGVYLELSYHKVRPKGSPLKTSGGRAPGHVKLKDSLERIRAILTAAQGRKLKPIECHRIMCHSADAVLSGGVRRSAMIALFSLDDSEMLSCKTGRWYSVEPWFANANNSVVLKRDDVKKKSFKRVFGMIRDWGEPGFYFTEDYDYGTNPCFHPDTRLWTSKGYERVGDLFNAGTVNQVVRDVRVGKGDELIGEARGVKLAAATHVFLTQKDAPVFKVTTCHGYSVTATASHEFPTTNGRKRLDQLRPGDTLFLPSGEGTFGQGGTEDEGLLLGLYVGNGTSDAKAAFMDIWQSDFDQKDQVLDILNSVMAKMPVEINRQFVPVGWTDQVVQENGHKKVRAGGIRFKRWLSSIADNEQSSMLKERVPESVWRGSREFVAGYLRGFFVTDGTVLLSGTGTTAALSLRLSQSNKALLEDVQVLLGMFGIVSRLYSRVPAGFRLMPDNKGKGEMKEYFCRETFELIINRPNSILFNKKVGLMGRKAALMTERMALRGEACKKPERHIAKVVSVEPAGTSDVYCITQPETNTVIANGIVAANCSEIGLYPLLKVTPEVQAELARRGTDANVGDVLSGVAFCNLSSINAAKLTSLDDFMAAAKAATLIGTIQASYTKMPYLGAVSEMIAERDALLGVSMTGMLDAPHIACNPEYQRAVAEQIKVWNAEYAARIGIRSAARTTCVKPEGTGSLAVGGVASGHHPHHARRYFRRVTADELEYAFQAFKAVNPAMCIRKPDGKWVIEFCVKAPALATIKDDIKAIEFLDMVKSTQMNWVIPGTAREDDAPGLHHNVSNTVTVQPDEWDKVAEYLWENRELFTGVSMLPSSGDKDFAYAPNESVSTPADEARWNAILASYKPVDYSAIVEDDDSTNLAGELACAGGACLI